MTTHKIIVIKMVIEIRFDHRFSECEADTVSMSYNPF
jgi:hypothetical protein